MSSWSDGTQDDDDKPLPLVIFRKDKDGGIGCVPYHHGRNNAIATTDRHTGAMPLLSLMLRFSLTLIYAY